MDSLSRLYNRIRTDQLKLSRLAPLPGLGIGDVSYIQSISQRTSDDSSLSQDATGNGTVNQSQNFEKGRISKFSNTAVKASPRKDPTLVDLAGSAKGKLVKRTLNYEGTQSAAEIVLRLSETMDFLTSASLIPDNAAVRAVDSIKRYVNEMGNHDTYQMPDVLVTVFAYVYIHSVWSVKSTRENLPVAPGLANLHSSQSSILDNVFKQVDGLRRANTSGLFFGSTDQDMFDQNKDQCYAHIAAHYQNCKYDNIFEFGDKVIETHCRRWFSYVRAVFIIEKEKNTHATIMTNPVYAEIAVFLTALLYFTDAPDSNVIHAKKYLVATKSKVMATFLNEEARDIIITKANATACLGKVYQDKKTFEQMKSYYDKTTELTPFLSCLENFDSENSMET
ncbi:hypothetical protein HDE_12491 [Halotydeus destructor]|nr:hypothetical protein HDE_12491 [Halotydeus destructor]